MLSTLYSRIRNALSRSETLSEGTTLPEFQLENQRGEKVSSKDIEDAVIYFYPKANTPGCTEEACSFRDSIEELKELEMNVYGVSTDSVETQKRFSEEHSLDFDLLADKNGDVAEKFGVMGSTGFAERTTFVVRGGRVDKVFSKVEPSGHVQDVLDYLEDSVE